MSIYSHSTLGNSPLRRPLLPGQGTAAHHLANAPQDTQVFTFLNSYKTTSSSNSCNVNWASKQAYLPLHLVPSFPAVLCSASAAGAVEGVEEAKKQKKKGTPSPSGQGSQQQYTFAEWSMGSQNFGLRQ